MLRWRALIDPSEDLRRVADHTIGCHKHGNSYPTTRSPRHQLVDALDMALLPIWHSDPLERPPRLLTVMTNRNRDQPQHGRAVYDTPQASAVGERHMT